MWRDDQPFPTLGKRIVWWVEFFKGKYYAGTSDTVTYHSANNGKIYEWVGVWRELPLGPIGGIITIKTVGDAIYFGTTHPESILRYDGKKWDRWDFDPTYEVAKFWVDSKGRLFCGTVTSDRVTIRHWFNNTWAPVWSIPAKAQKWCVQGVAVPGGVVVAFRDGTLTRIWKISY